MFAKNYRSFFVLVGQHSLGGGRRKYTAKIRTTKNEDRIWQPNVPIFENVKSGAFKS